MKKEGDVLVLGWCDNGYTDSLFTSHLTALALKTAHTLDIQGVGIIQTIGGQIARQRQDLLRDFEASNAEWLLWVDSDIMIPYEAFELLWNSKDVETRPVVCGVYFITMEMNQTLPQPYPCIFVKADDGKNKPVHPLPENELIPIDVAGLGFTLMHKSVAHKLRETYGNTTFSITIGDNHISEDVSFFYKLKDLGIPVYAHTGALVPHVKRFLLDANYYNLWWNAVAPMREAREKANDNNL